MVIPPKSEIVFLKVPVELDNKNELRFRSPNLQFEYFRYLPGATAYDNCTYQRKDGYIRVNRPFDEMIDYNYCMYQNENHSGKWYYAFIDKVEYVNDNCSHVYITTDVWQTYCFDIRILPSFIERQMGYPDEDVPGANLVPESLEIGEVVIDAGQDISVLKPLYVLAYGRNPHDDGLSSSAFADGIILNGIFTGLYYYVGSAKKVREMINRINGLGGGDEAYGQSIVTIFTIPMVAMLNFTDEEGNVWTLEKLQTEIGSWVPSSFTASPVSVGLPARPTNFGGYVPQNAKLLQYPYTYIGFSPKNGNQKILRYENFSSPTAPYVSLISEVNPNPVVEFVPENYKTPNFTNEVNVTEVCELSGYPSISWISNYFNSWLAQNSSIVNLSLERENLNYEQAQVGNLISGATAVGGLIGSAVTGNPLGALQSTGSLIGAGINYHYAEENHDLSIRQTLAQVEKQSLLPNQASVGSSSTTLIGYDLQDNQIFCRYTIKEEWARRIDRYFSMYGYQVNQLDQVKVDSRPNWNYVKTRGVNIIGAIPQDDLRLIKDLFNNGITFWHNPDTYLDYYQPNK